MSDSVLRGLLFMSLLALLGIAEWRWPRHLGAARRWPRWPVNLGMGSINALCLRLLTPWLAVDAAVWAHVHNVGLLRWLHVPTVPAALLAFIALDLVIYGQHRLLHRIDALWRLHRVHHTDTVLDVSSGVRFHPLEILLSMGVKIAAVLVLGATPAVVLGFEIVLSSFALVTHANLGLPVRLDAWLRWVFITPDMHRIHHSVRRAEHDTNFGFHVSWWDHLFGTYLAEPRQTQQTLKLGLEAFRDADAQRLASLLIQPVRRAR